MNLQLNGKVFLITGGEGGIGSAVVKGVAAEGGIPVIFGKNEAAALQLCADIKANGGQCYFFHTELTDPEQCKANVAACLEQLGRIDVLVNNAGINDMIGLEAGSREQFLSSLHNNLVHYYHMAQLVLPALKQTKGNIINISSKTALTGQGDTSGYVAAKAGQLGLTREWAVELLPYGIRVNAVIPAEVMTGMYHRWLQSFDHPEAKLASITNNIPLGKRMTTQEEIADSVLFLASPRSSHITGQFWHVDGGYVHLDRALNDKTQNKTRSSNG
jgi:L-fucose dehydrogenase